VNGDDSNKLPILFVLRTLLFIYTRYLEKILTIAEENDLNDHISKFLIGTRININNPIYNIGYFK